MTRLVRQLAKECAARSPCRDADSIAAATCARWGARLSALLVRGNAACHRAARVALPEEARPWRADAGTLPHLLPEGPCLYEVACLAQWHDEEAGV